MLLVSVLFKIRRAVCNILIVVVGYLIPSLSSAKAILTHDHESITEWLTFWTVFSIFILLEWLVDAVLWKVPFYYEFKVVTVCWLTLPRYQGAYRIYHEIIKPYFDQHEDAIDRKIDEVASKVRGRAATILQKFL